MGNIRNPRLHESDAVSNDDLEIIRQAADIVRIIGAYVPLRKAGVEHVGLCPFHKEKTPSFSVNGQKRVYLCRGCGEGGDVFRFVQRIENTDFRHAKAIVAEQAGVPIPDRPWTVAERKEKADKAELRRESRKFWQILCRDYSNLTASVYRLEHAACRWMRERIDSEENSETEELCWFIFRLVPFADDLENELQSIRQAYPQSLAAEYEQKHRSGLPADYLDRWEQDHEQDRKITARIVALLAIAENRGARGDGISQVVEIGKRSGEI